MTRVVARTRRVLLLIVVVVLSADLALLAAPAPAAHLSRRLDRMRELLQTEADAALVGIDADHEQAELVADGHEVFGPVDGPVRHLRDVEQPVHPRLELHERAEVGEAHDLTRDAGPHRTPQG